MCVYCVISSLSDKWYSSGMHVDDCDAALGALCDEAAGYPGRELS